MGCKETTLMDGDKAYHVEDEYEDEGSVKETHFQGFTIKELDRRKAEARLGYLSINLYNPPAAATWGRYNDRKINDSWVRELVNDFKRQLGNCTENDSIDMVIKPEWLKNSDDVVKVICHDSPPCLVFNTRSASPVPSPLLIFLISDLFAAR